MAEDDFHSRGGAARAKRLSAEDRSAIARKAALARHGKTLPQAVAEGTLIVGDLRISCAVLDDSHNNMRVLTQEGFLNAIGRAGKAKGGEGAGVDGKAAFLRAKNLEPFISNDLIASTTPVEFVPFRGPGYQGRAFGYKASLLPEVCWVYQDAMIAQKLLPSQRHIGEAARTFLKGLTNHAIEDLVDLATGFGDLRKRRAIDLIIEQYVSPERLPYMQMFDLDFYRNVYRLNGWPFDPEKSARPGVIGHYTNDIYDRLAPGVKDALHAKVKRNSNGRPTEKLTQYMTKDEGKLRLKELLGGVKLLMTQSPDWKHFKVLLDQYYPRFGDTMQLPLGHNTYALPGPNRIGPTS